MLDIFSNISNTSKILVFIILLIIVAVIISYFNNKKSNKIAGGKKANITFILYYVDWCPHCKTVKPECEKLENDKSFKNITIKKINCEEDEKAAEENNIEGFPTILFSKNGKVESYEGGREYGDFKQFLEKKI